MEWELFLFLLVDCLIVNIFDNSQEQFVFLGEDNAKNMGQSISNILVLVNISLLRIIKYI